MGSDEPATGAAQYATFVKGLLDAEEARRTVIESRGAGVITSSGALVTLLLAFAALVTKQDGFTLGTGTRILLTISVIAFIGAAVLAMTTYTPRTTEIVDANQLKTELRKIWDQDTDYARIMITSTWLDQLGAAQRSNDTKAWLLVAAVLAEVAAVLMLGLAVLAVL